MSNEFLDKLSRVYPEKPVQSKNLSNWPPRRVSKTPEQILSERLDLFSDRASEQKPIQVKSIPKKRLQGIKKQRQNTA